MTTTHQPGPASAPTRLDVASDDPRTLAEIPDDPEGPGAIGAMIILAPAGFLSWAGILALAGATTPARIMLAGAALTLPLAARVWWAWR